MPALVTSATTESCLRELLSAAGYELSRPRSHGETGVDIRASRGTEDLFIEVIGFKSSPPARAKDFYEIFFRAVSRLDHGATTCVIALPLRFGAGLPARARQHGSAWKRIGQAFPELQIWLVDTESRSITKREWNEWLDVSISGLPLRSLERPTPDELLARLRSRQSVEPGEEIAAALAAERLGR